MRGRGGGREAAGKLEPSDSCHNNTLPLVAVHFALDFLMNQMYVP